MTLQEIYTQFTRGSKGFCKAVETHCGFETTLTETARIAAQAATPDDFQRIWENEDGWKDENNEDE